MPTVLKGRGSLTNRNSRYELHTRSPVEGDSWLEEDPLETPAGPATTITNERARSILTRNDSPDIPFDQSLNPYRGCEHGCIYCYARPSHAYLNLSPGLDFETKIYAKSNAADLLREELGRPSYRPKVIVLGSNTDPYQPIERRLGLTSQILQVLNEFNHPVAITTKSASVLKDLDLLSHMASRKLLRVFISVGTLDRHIARTLEPRASTPAARIDAMHTLAAAGIPVGVLVAPVVPALTDHDLERILTLSSKAGAVDAWYALLRLPREVADLFQEWLRAHYPLRESHVMNQLREMHGGRVYDSTFSTRMTGTGVFADLLRQRFRSCCKKLGLNLRRVELDTTQFLRPGSTDAQLELF
jgi:DNA repair photolyase